jgi:hypothetical protein
LCLQTIVQIVVRLQVPNLHVGIKYCDTFISLI